MIRRCLAQEVFAEQRLTKYGKSAELSPLIDSNNEKGLWFFGNEMRGCCNILVKDPMAKVNSSANRICLVFSSKLTTFARPFFRCPFPPHTFCSSKPPPCEISKLFARLDE